MNRRIIGTLFLAVVCGCHATESSWHEASADSELVAIDQSAYTPNPQEFTVDQLEGRLYAAKKIDNEALRNDAFALIARDAASSNQVEIVKSVLPDIGNQKMFDAAAQECSKSLACGGDVRAAADVALMIHNQERRQSVLSLLAGGRLSRRD